MIVPKSIQTKRLLLRCWESDDAEILSPVLQSNFEHLKEWIPERISKPASLAELELRLSGFKSDFNAGKEWRFAIFTSDEMTLLGEVSLFPRNKDGRVNFEFADRVEIGYWLRSDVTGKGYATEAAEAMFILSKSLKSIKLVEIRCDSENVPSAAVPNRLGFQLAQPDELKPGKMVWYFNF
jgi:RimJ/RimL family protein N-acetyltransferase